jgi:hypothetical protein
MLLALTAMAVAAKWPRVGSLPTSFYSLLELARKAEAVCFIIGLFIQYLDLYCTNSNLLLLSALRVREGYGVQVGLAWFGIC